MADFYDPAGGRHRLLLVMVGVMWCPHCGVETREMAALEPALAAEGAQMLQVLIDGPSRGQGPDRCDLDDWASRYRPPFPLLLDVGARRLAAYGTIDGVPLNLLVDARTMEVLDVTVGAPADLAAYVRAGLAWVDTSPR